MGNHKKNGHDVMSRQPELFDNGHGLQDGALDVRLAFRGELSKALRRHKLSRWQVAGEASRLGGREIGKDALDKCCASDFAWGLRAEDLPSLLCILQDLTPLRVLLAPLGVEVLTPNEARTFRLAQLLQEKARVEAEIERLSHQ